MMPIRSNRICFGQIQSRRYGAMKRAIALGILLLASGHTAAKCRSGFLDVSGTVVSSSGKPAPGAIVGISWNEFEGVAGPAIAVSDLLGRYRIPIGYTTYSGKGVVYEDACDYRLLSISVIAYKGGLRSGDQRFQVGMMEGIRLPALKVWVEIDQKKSSVTLIGPGD